MNFKEKIFTLTLAVSTPFGLVANHRDLETEFRKLSENKEKYLLNLIDALNPIAVFAIVLQ